MNFNLKYSILSTVAVIFIMGSVAVAGTQLRGGGGGGGDTRGFVDGGNANHEVVSSSAEVGGPNSGGEIEQLDLLPVDERKLDWSDYSESDFIGANGSPRAGVNNSKSDSIGAKISRGGDNSVVSWESDDSRVVSWDNDRVVSWDNYESNPAKNGWGINCPVPRESTVGTSCKSFVPHPDNRPEAIFQCKYPNFFKNGDVLYFQCTNTDRDPRWTSRRRNE
jgi:hypothetical protein